jgi:hypothetical protein
LLACGNNRVLAQNSDGIYHYIDVTYEEQPVPFRGQLPHCSNHGALLDNKFAVINAETSSIEFYDMDIRE